MDSARKQAGNAKAWLTIGAPSPARVEMAGDNIEWPCPPISEVALAPIVDRAARAEKLDPKLLRSVIQQESGFRPCAVSNHGAQGLMQLMPATAAELGVADSFDPVENVTAGSKYLRQLLDRYGGDLLRALGAYNAGPTTVDEAGGIPAIPETQDYVSSIFSRLTR